LSAGTGNLLLALVDYLAPENDETLKRRVENFHAYDLSEESLLIYINRILGRFETFPEGLKLKVFPGDALAADIEETFDIILGNPPYIGEKNHKAFFNRLKKTPFGQRFYESKMDLYHYFLYLGWEHLSKEGVMGTITTNYFFTADGASRLRNYLKEKITIYEINNYRDEKLFKEALGQHNVIMVTGAKKVGTPTRILVEEGDFTLSEEALYGDYNTIEVYTKNQDYRLIKKIKEESTFLLGDFFDIHQGIVSGADVLHEKKQLSYEIDAPGSQGIFVLSEEEIRANNLLSSKYLRPFYKNSHIDHFTLKRPSDKWILYLTGKEGLTAEDVEYRYLSSFRPILEDRREVREGKRSWYALQWPREEEIFTLEKIVVPHRNRMNRFMISREDFYASADVYYIIPRGDYFSLEIIAGILNSRLMYFWLYNRGKKKGPILEMYATPLRRIPIKYAHSEALEAAVKAYMSSGDSSVLKTIDRQVYEMYHLNKEEIEVVEEFYNCMGTEDEKSE
jgi:adenine-specific DNA-methyltransferase